MSRWRTDRERVRRQRDKPPALNGSRRIDRPMLRMRILCSAWWRLTGGRGARAQRLTDEDVRTSACQCGRACLSDEISRAQAYAE